MPNIPPKKPFRQVPSSERLKQMLTGSMTGAMPAAAQSGAPPASFRQAAMQNSPYNPSDYTPEELAKYRDMLMRDQSSVFPSRTDVPGEFYNNMFHTKEYHPGGEQYARQDSLYTAQKLQDAEAMRRRAMINDLMQELGGIFGPKNVRLER